MGLRTENGEISVIVGDAYRAAVLGYKEVRLVDSPDDSIIKGVGSLYVEIDRLGDFQLYIRGSSCGVFNDTDGMMQMVIKTLATIVVA